MVFPPVARDPGRFGGGSPGPITALSIYAAKQSDASATRAFNFYSETVSSSLAGKWRGALQDKRKAGAAVLG
jgi:hypothetical protein